MKSDCSIEYECADCGLAHISEETRNRLDGDRAVPNLCHLAQTFDNSSFNMFEIPISKGVDFTLRGDTWSSYGIAKPMTRGRRLA